MTHYEKTILSLILDEGLYITISKLARKMGAEIDSLKNVLEQLGRKGFVLVFAAGKGGYRSGKVELTHTGQRELGKTGRLSSEGKYSESPDEKYRRWIHS